MKQDINICTDSSKNLLKVNLSKIPDSRCVIDIYDTSGARIKQITLHEKISFIEMGTLTPGLYILILSSGKKIKAFRYVKE